jgi:NAD-dependent SIR2 family protein deacetylase
MIESVSRRLRPPSPNLENHLTLLRLARNLDDRVCLITTNFDTLFEQALERLDGVGVGKTGELCLTIAALARSS